MKPIVLVLCTGNSCRSQMAEGFLRKYHGEKYDVRSAGTNPQKTVQPLAIKVMAEIGIDITKQYPKPLSDFLGHLPVKHLILVCDKASQTCPRIWPGAFTRTDMPFDDPGNYVGPPDEKLNDFRRVRDLIGEAMKNWQPQSQTKAQ